MAKGLLKHVQTLMPLFALGRPALAMAAPKGHGPLSKPGEVCTMAPKKLIVISRILHRAHLDDNTLANWPRPTQLYQPHTLRQANPRMHDNDTLCCKTASPAKQRKVFMRESHWPTKGLWVRWMRHHATRYVMFRRPARQC